MHSKQLAFFRGNGTTDSISKKQKQYDQFPLKSEKLTDEDKSSSPNIVNHKREKQKQ